MKESLRRGRRASDVQLHSSHRMGAATSADGLKMARKIEFRLLNDAGKVYTIKQTYGAQKTVVGDRLGVFILVQHRHHFTQEQTQTQRLRDGINKVE